MDRSGLGNWLVFAVSALGICLFLETAGFVSNAATYSSTKKVVVDFSKKTITKTAHPNTVCKLEGVGKEDLDCIYVEKTDIPEGKCYLAWSDDSKQYLFCNPSNELTLAGNVSHTHFNYIADGVTIFYDKSIKLLIIDGPRNFDSTNFFVYPKVVGLIFKGAFYAFVQENSKSMDVTNRPFDGIKFMHFSLLTVFVAKSNFYFYNFGTIGKYILTTFSYHENSGVLFFFNAQNEIKAVVYNSKVYFSRHMAVNPINDVDSRIVSTSTKYSIFSKNGDMPKNVVINGKIVDVSDIAEYEEKKVKGVFDEGVLVGIGISSFLYTSNATNAYKASLGFNLNYLLTSQGEMSLVKDALMHEGKIIARHIGSEVYIDSQKIFTKRLFINTCDSFIGETEAEYDDYQCESIGGAAFVRFKSTTKLICFFDESKKDSNNPDWCSNQLESLPNHKSKHMRNIEYNKVYVELESGYKIKSITISDYAMPEKCVFDNMGSAKCSISSCLSCSLKTGLLALSTSDEFKLMCFGTFKPREQIKILKKQETDYYLSKHTAWLKSRNLVLHDQKLCCEKSSERCLLESAEQIALVSKDEFYASHDREKSPESPKFASNLQSNLLDKVLYNPDGISLYTSQENTEFKDNIFFIFGVFVLSNETAYGTPQENIILYGEKRVNAIGYRAEEKVYVRYDWKPTSQLATGKKELNPSSLTLFIKEMVSPGEWWGKYISNSKISILLSSDSKLNNVIASSNDSKTYIILNEESDASFAQANPQKHYIFPICDGTMTVQKSLLRYENMLLAFKSSEEKSSVSVRASELIELDKAALHANSCQDFIKLETIPELFDCYQVENVLVFHAKRPLANYRVIYTASGKNEVAENFCAWKKGLEFTKVAIKTEQRDLKHPFSSACKDDTGNAGISNVPMFGLSDNEIHVGLARTGAYCFGKELFASPNAVFVKFAKLNWMPINNLLDPLGAVSAQCSQQLDLTGARASTNNRSVILWTKHQIVFWGASVGYSACTDGGDALILIARAHYVGIETNGVKAHQKFDQHKEETTNGLHSYFDLNNKAQHFSKSTKKKSEIEGKTFLLKNNGNNEGSLTTEETVAIAVGSFIGLFLIVILAYFGTKRLRRHRLNHSGNQQTTLLGE